MVSPMPMPEFPLAPALVSTPSPRDLMLPPRDMPPSMDTLDTMDTILARGLPMLMLMLPTLPMAMVSPMPMPEFPLAPALVSTPSPRDLMLPPRDMPPSMDTLDTTDTTLARGLLMLKLMLMLSM